MTEQSSRSRGRRAKSAVTITAYRDGPLVVRGPVEIIGHEYAPIARAGRPLALCRCGKSRVKPFCDGTHKLIGFRAPPVETQSHRATDE